MNMEVSYISSPEFYSLALYILGSISLPIHLFGAYCILCQTPDTMKRVKWVMFNLHAWSCSLDILLGLLGQPFIVPPVFGGAPMGLLHLLNVDPGIMVYMMVTLILMVSISTGAIFENRFYLLFVEKTWWRFARYPYYIINVALAFLYYVPTMIGIPDQTEAREWIFRKHPEVRRFDSPEHPIFVVAYDSVARDWIGIRMIIAIPACIIATPQILIIFIGYLNLNTPEMNSVAYMMMSIHGASATLIMLYCHHPYREFCKELLRGRLRVFNRWTPFVSVTSHSEVVR
ncbi:hypothetical protein GCK72_019754 [Caenorhabditis remanei]|uniref:Uncharacterized protein n=1 Tax=Caenorhabditis remanei TaxID=31234 RepID=A0A6A5GDK5_CAERE|nr:hypothetical protein GCK72_019754 [Caenorhabditis remanei]KAF1753198.1 hypothetical protein GCK72_019754 [Caenorhabditis remanei]